MILEGKALANYLPDRFTIVNIADGNNRRSFNIEQASKLLRPSEMALKLMVNLIGRNEAKSPIVSVFPFDEDKRPYVRTPLDVIELFNPAYPLGIGIYCNEYHEVTFGVIDNTDEIMRRNGRKLKLRSSGYVFGDALIAREAFDRFIEDNGVQNVAIDGPTKDETFIVMTRPESEAIAQYDNKEILGLAFVPGRGHDLHGDIKLLTRKKQV